MTVGEREGEREWTWGKREFGRRDRYLGYDTASFER